LTARYDGDAGTQVSTSGVLLQVAQQSTSTTLMASANPVLTAQGLVLTAKVRNGKDATGVITFLDGTSVLGSVALDASGTATLALASSVQEVTSSPRAIGRQLQPAFDIHRLL